MAGPLPTVSDPATVYRELCENYRAIDELRTKLLGLLPFGTLVGIAALWKAMPHGRDFLPVAACGFVATLGLFAYELHGIKKCAFLIHRGQHLEEDELGVAGAFSHRPQKLAGFIDEPVAASVIYPASLAMWTFVGLAREHVRAATVAPAVAVFVVTCVASYVGIRLMEHKVRKTHEPGPACPLVPSR